MMSSFNQNTLNVRGGKKILSRSTDLIVPEGDGRNLLGNGELRDSRRQSRYIRLWTTAKRERDGTPVRINRRIPIEEISTAESTPTREEDSGLMIQKDENRSRVRTDTIASLFEVSAKFEKEGIRRAMSVVETRKEIEKLWVAESLHAVKQIAQEPTVRPTWELRDARRVAAGECGFYKMAKMLAEGKLSHYEQDCYWASIAKGSKNKVVEFLAKSSATAKHNLTEHMRRTVALSLDKRKNLFDSSCHQEVTLFLRFLRGAHELRCVKSPHGMVAQMGWFMGLPSMKINVEHDVKLGFGNDLTVFLNRMGFPEVARFIASTVVFVGGVCSMDSWSGRAWLFVQYLVGFPATGAVLYSVAGWSTQATQPILCPWLAQAQSEKDVANLLDTLEPHAETIWGALASVVGSAFKVELPQETWKNAVRAKRFANITTVLSSVDKMVDHLGKIFSLVKEAVQAWAHGVSILEWRLSTISARMPLFAAKVNTLYQAGGVMKARADKRYAKMAVELFKEGSQYTEYVMGGGASPSQYNAFNTVWRMVWEMYKAAEEYFLTHAKRDAPFVLHFIGPTGIGKSLLSQHIVADLAKMLRVPYTKDFDHYFRNTKSPYWEGYTHQHVVFYDDFLQSPKLREEECNELIHVANNAPYLLNMAQADAKGRVLFTSPFVVLSSNTDIPDDLEIAEPDAVRRRRDVVIHMKVKKEHADSYGAVDLEKMARRRVAFDPTIYQFTIVCNRSGKEIFSCDKYKDLLDYIARRYCVKERRPLTQKQIEDEIRREMGVERDKCLAQMQQQENAAFVTSATFFAEVPSEPDAPFVTPWEEFSSEGTSVSEMNEIENDVFKLFEERLTPDQQIETAQTWYQQAHSIALGRAYAAKLIAIRSKEEFCNFMGYTKAQAEKAWTSWTNFLGPVVYQARHYTMHIPGLPPEREQRLKQIEFVIGIIAAALGTIGAVCYFRNNTGAKREPPKAPEIKTAEQFASGDERTTGVKRVMKVKTFITSKEAQASNDPRALALVKERYSNATCLVRLIKGEASAVGVHGILIGGKFIAVPYHLVGTTPQASEIEVVTNTTTFRFPIDDINVCINWKNNDLAIIVMPNHFPSYAKLVNHFVNERDITQLSLGFVGMLSMLQCDDHALPMLQMVQNARRSGEHSYFAYGDRSEEIRIIDSVHYQAQTVAGDCGAPLIWFHPSVSRKIIGFHVAGGQNLGACNILSYELMSHVFATLTTTQIEAPVTIDAVPTLRDGVANIGQMAYYGLISKELQFRQPEKSEIIPSKIHGEFPVITKPAALLIEDGVSPLELGVRKGCTTNCILPPQDLALVEDQILTHYLGVSSTVEPRVLTFDEGLNGVLGNKWIRPLRMRTSPGFPYITEPRKQPGKLDYVTFDERFGRWVASKRLEDRVFKRIEMAERREIPETVFVDVLKDERRELEKVEAKKTRVFNTCPMDLNIAIRMYFGYLSAIVMENHVTHDIAVGINYHSESWEMLYRRLRSNGPNWIAGDYSNYDKTFPRQLMMMVANISNRIYNDGNDVIRETLMETLSNRFHLANRVVYFQTHGNPSGNPLTTIINSFGNMALMRLAWLHLARQHDPRLELDFADHVALSVYGDDNVATVSTQASWFTMNAIATTLKQFGVVYTPPKIGKHESPDFIPINEVSYLKRYFHEYKGHIFAPLPVDRIKETCNWIRKSSDDVLATKINVHMAQLEMFHWGRDAFDAFASEVYAILAKHNITPKAVTWDYFYTKYLDGTLEVDPSGEPSQDPSALTPISGEASLCSEAREVSRPGTVLGQQMVAQNKENIKLTTKVPLPQSNSKIKVDMGNGLKIGLVSKQVSNTTVNIGNQTTPTMIAEKGKAQKLSKNTKVVVATSKSKTRTSGSTNFYSANSRNTPASPAMQEQLVAVTPLASTKQLVSTPQGTNFNLNGKELLLRVDGPQLIQAFPLAPGQTGAPKLDSLARQYAWVEWQDTVVMEYKALNSIANDGVWYYQVVHDATSQDIMEKVNWNVMSRAFVAQKACLDFKINVPSRSMANARSSPLNSDRFSWILFIYKGDQTPLGEFWLTYKTKMGGLAATVKPPITYEVKNGVFIHPISGEPMDGIPVASEGKTTHYHFDGRPLTRKETEEFVSLTGGTPQMVVRTNDTKAIVDKDARVESVVVQNPTQAKIESAQAIMDLVGQGVDMAKEIVPVAKRASIKVGKGARYAKRRLQAWKKRFGKKSRDGDNNAQDLQDNEEDDEEKIEIAGPFAKYSGRVTVESGVNAMRSYNNVASITPIFYEQTGSSTPEGASVRFAFLPFLGSLIGGIASAAVPEVIGAIANKISRQPKVVHKGIEAASFVYDQPQGVISMDGDDDSDDEGAGDNPLPDIPDFDDDPDAPGQFVPWVTTNRHLCGFITDNNGTPIVKWLGGTYGKEVLHIGCPEAKWYHNDRMPWDQENKRMLACYIELDREMQGHYILMHSVNWGDDACGHWLRNLPGATYFGTVARFSGLSDSRSVIRVDDVATWNKQEVHLLIGQSKFKYFAADEGRACMFYLTLGAVADARIAENFLDSFDTSGTNSMVNIYIDDKGKEKKQGDFTSLTDRTNRSRKNPLPLGLEPFGPGFAKNLKAYSENPQAAMLRAQLPVAIEAGPIRGALLARYDEQNGWWQHVPYCALSYTSLSARWNWCWLMGDENTEGQFNAGDASKGMSNSVMRVEPPSILCSGAFVCIETFTMGGNTSWRSVCTKPGTSDILPKTTSTSYKSIVTISGPLVCSRQMFPAQTFDIRVGAETSRPTAAVAAANKDCYVTVVFNAYILKDEAAAWQWVYHEMDFERRNEKDIYKVQASSSDRATLSNYIYLYKAEKKGMSYKLTDTRWAGGDENASTTTLTEVPLRDTCPIFTPMGRSVDSTRFLPNNFHAIPQVSTPNQPDTLEELEPPPTLGEDVQPGGEQSFYPEEGGEVLDASQPVLTASAEEVVANPSWCSCRR